MKQKRKKIVCTTKITVDVPFWSYGKDALDDRMATQIKKYIIDTLKRECTFIPLHTSDGEEDCSLKSKVRLTFSEYCTDS